MSDKKTGKTLSRRQFISRSAEVGAIAAAMAAMGPMPAFAAAK